MQTVRRTMPRKETPGEFSCETSSGKTLNLENPPRAAIARDGLCRLWGLYQATALSRSDAFSDPQDRESGGAMAGHLHDQDSGCVGEAGRIGE